jgi:hypothetical protein
MASNHDDYWDWPSPSDPEFARCDHSLTDDELDEADAQACWALEVQSQVALMNHRIRY